MEVGANVGGHAEHALAAAFDRVAAIEGRLSRFDPRSDIFRFNAAAAGECMVIGEDTGRVLAAARSLHEASRGVFDISLGSGADAWCYDGDGLKKLGAGVRLDLGGIGKGYAVDCAVEALIAGGISAGWVNAGGDLRVFGAVALPLDLRDEEHGGVRRFGTLSDGAFATSRLGGVHVSVADDECLWADALTKLVIASGDAAHPLLARYGACAWLHSDGVNESAMAELIRPRRAILSTVS